MENLKNSTKIVLYATLLSGILWFGGYCARLLLTFQLFQPKGLSFKPYITNENIQGIFTTLTPVITFTFITYLAFLVFFTLFLITSKISLKKEGWLFVIMLVIYITAPFELFLMTIDWKIIMALLNQNFNAGEVTQFFVKRYSVLSSFALIEIFTYAGIIFLGIFKPLRMKS